MDRSELARRAGKGHVPMAVIEKDYVLTLVLHAIAESELKESLAFKGGTAIKKIYFGEARFSEDLDFTVSGKMTVQEIEAAVRKLFEGRLIQGIEITAVEHEKTSAGLRMALKFTGPLKHAQRIRLDFSFREKPLVPLKEEKVVDSYGVGECRVWTMNLEEILTEKLRAMSSRNAPRDLYDIWFLTGKGVKIDKGLVARKFGIYNEKFEMAKAMEHVKELKTNWKTDLQQFLKEVPPFERIEKEVAERLGKEFHEI